MVGAAAVVPALLLAIPALGTSSGCKAAPADTPAPIELFVHDPVLQAGPDSRCVIALCRSLLDAIRASRRTIDFAIYGLRNQPELFDALVAAQARGVRIRGVVDADVDGGNPYPDTDRLVGALRDVRSDRDADHRELARRTEAAPPPPRESKSCPRPPGTQGPVSCFDVALGDQRLRIAQASRDPIEFRGHILHHKFFVLDRSVVWTGSANLSDTDTGGYNANVALLLRGSHVARRFTGEFERLWRDGRFHDPTPATRAGDLPSDTSFAGPREIGVWFSPHEHPVDRAVLPLVRGATRTIRVAIFYLTSKRIAEALLTAQRRGVDVRILIDATGAANAYSKHQLLRQAGLSVKVENFGGKMHAKAASFDGESLLVGSMNWTAAGESSNDENVVVLRERPDLVAAFERAFEAMWDRVPERWGHADPGAESPDSPPACTDGMDDDHDGLIDAADPGCSPDLAHSPGHG